MLLFRRFLVLAALMFWQGGFVFYASVVVPIGTEVFAHWYPSPAGAEVVSGKRQQGRITRTVAWWLNVAGVVALLPMGWDVIAGPAPGRRKHWRRLLYLSVVVLQALLIWLYFQMDGLFNRDTLRLSDESLFDVRHRVYLWLCSVQWSCCVLFLFATLQAWRAEDANSPGAVR